MFFGLCGVQHCINVIKIAIGQNAVQIMTREGDDDRIRACGDNEFIVRGGKSATGKMFVRATLTQLEAPATSARSAFDKWLPDLLSNIPNGDVEIHTANESVLIVEQPSTDFLMIVIDQEYEED